MTAAEMFAAHADGGDMTELRNPADVYPRVALPSPIPATRRPVRKWKLVAVYIDDGKNGKRHVTGKCDGRFFLIDETCRTDT